MVGSYFKYTLFFLAFFCIAQAEEAPEDIHYSLKNLKPVKISRYTPSRDTHRDYFQLQNHAGTHYFIYTESSSAKPLPQILELRNQFAKAGAICQAQLSCAKNAFCTGKCKNLYYEISNAPPDRSKISSNHCQIQKLECNEGK